VPRLLVPANKNRLLGLWHPTSNRQTLRSGIRLNAMLCHNEFLAANSELKKHRVFAFIFYSKVII
jgi:hypothetical protein